MLKEVLVLGKGIMLVDDGFTEEEHEIIKQKKHDMQVVDEDGRVFMGYCRECGRAVWEKDKYFYLENKDGIGNILVDVCHSYH